jgi:hypothetical protein
VYALIRVLRVVTFVELFTGLILTLDPSRADAFLPSYGHINSTHSLSPEYTCVTEFGATTTQVHRLTNIVESYFNDRQSWNGVPNSRTKFYLVPKPPSMSSPYKFLTCEQLTAQGVPGTVRFVLRSPSDFSDAGSREFAGQFVGYHSSQFQDWEAAIINVRDDYIFRGDPVR